MKLTREDEASASIIICGAVRNIVEFSDVLIKAAYFRRHNDINIILSTWEGQRAKCPALFDAAESCGIIVVESRYPVAPTYLTLPGPGNIWLQKKAFAAALPFVPEGHLILKTRTDYLVKQFFELADHLCNAERSSDNSIFTSTICVSNVSLTHPFDISDLHFIIPYHIAHEIAEANIDLELELWWNLMVEARWFAPLYAKISPYVYSWCAALNGVEIFNIVKSWAAGGKVEIPKFVASIIAHYLFIIKTNYRICGKELPRPKTLRGLFLLDPDHGVISVRAGGVSISNPSIISGISDIISNPDDNFSSLVAESFFRCDKESLGYCSDDIKSEIEELFLFNTEYREQSGATLIANGLALRQLAGESSGSQKTKAGDNFCLRAFFDLIPKSKFAGPSFKAAFFKKNLNSSLGLRALEQFKLLSISDVVNKTTLEIFWLKFAYFLSSPEASDIIRLRYPNEELSFPGQSFREHSTNWLNGALDINV